MSDYWVGRTRTGRVIHAARVGEDDSLCTSHPWSRVTYRLTEMLADFGDATRPTCGSCLGELYQDAAAKREWLVDTLAAHLLQAVFTGRLELDPESSTAWHRLRKFEILNAAALKPNLLEGDDQ